MTPLLLWVWLASAAGSPPEALVARTAITVDKQTVATAHAGVMVTVHRTVGLRTEVETRGPVRIRGWVPKRNVGRCTSQDAPVRLQRAGPAVGSLPAGVCFRVLRADPKLVQFSDERFVVPMWVDSRHLGEPPEPMFTPQRDGFSDYRFPRIPLSPIRGGDPWLTLEPGTRQVRAVHSEQGFTMVEILGAVVRARTWWPTTRLPRGLFDTRVAAEGKRRALLHQAKATRTWVSLSEDSACRSAPSGPDIGRIGAAAALTVNRRSGAWVQVQSHRERGKIDGRFWVRAANLAP